MIDLPPTAHAAMQLPPSFRPPQTVNTTVV